MLGNLFPMTVDFELINIKGVCIQGSITGSIQETQQCVNFCIKNNIFPEIELINIQDINTVHENIVTSNVRYRYVIDMKSIYEEV